MRARFDRWRATIAAVATALVPAAAPAQAAPPATTAGATPAESSPPPAYRQGFLVLPFAGANLPLGDSSMGFDLGARVGALAGWHVWRSVSANLELSADTVSPNDVSVGEEQSIAAYDLTLSPLYHVALETGELVIGPKVGRFRHKLSQRDWNGDLDLVRDDHGFVYGLNVGLFGDVAKTAAVGVMLSLLERRASESCVMVRGGADQCASATTKFKDLGVSVAALF